MQHINSSTKFVPTTIPGLFVSPSMEMQELFNELNREIYPQTYEDWLRWNGSGNKLGFIFIPPKPVYREEEEEFVIYED